MNIICVYVVAMVAIVAADPDPVDPDLKEALDYHNLVRGWHGAEPLSWSNELAENAQAQLEKGPKAVNLGNLASVYITDPTPCTTASKMWYKAEKNYNYDKPEMEKVMAWGTFSQMVYKASKQIGIAYKKNHETKFTNVMADYYPEEGDTAELYKQNVERKTNNK